MSNSQELPAAPDIRAALRRAFNLGQTYWDQADSESYAANRRSEATRATFDAHVEEVAAEVDAALGAQRAAEARWIPVGERLPEPCHEVLIWCADANTVGFAWWREDAAEWCMPEPQAAGYFPTHWMPLPDAPTPPKEPA